MKHRFIHEFEGDPPLGDFDVELDAPEDATIQFELEGENIWLSATRKGWLHLARISAEMAMHTQMKGGYHFHRTYDWKESSESGREVSFEVRDNLPDHRDGRPNHIPASFKSTRR